MDGSVTAFGSHQPSGAPWSRIADSEIRLFSPEPSWSTPELEEKFTEFVAGTFFKAMLEAMRKTVGDNTVLHGGRAEEIFRGQLDATIAQRLAVNGGSGFSEKLYRQFMLQHGTSTNQTDTRDSSADAYERSSSETVGRTRDITV